MADDFNAWTAERERQLRAVGEFDLADMYRELRARDWCCNTFDCEAFDRGRPRALVLLIGRVPRGLTIDPAEVALGR